MRPLMPDESAMDGRSELFERPDVEAHFLPDGEIRLTSRSVPSPRARTTLDWLAHWAVETPDQPFVTEAAGGAGAHSARLALTYAQAWHDAGRIGAGLLATGFRAGDRLLVVAPNGIAHMRIALAAFRAGIVYVPVAPQYVGPGADVKKLAAVLDMIDPVAAFCAGAQSAPHLIGHVPLLEGEAALETLIAQAQGYADPDISALDPEGVAKLLLTSGSTGAPKGVPYSHTVMTANTQATLDVWPFLKRHKPILVDWLPWNHAFGGSNNVHIVLSQGGMLHVDSSRGRPENFARSIEELRTLRPTFHGAVPAGWGALLQVIEADRAFCEAFFSRLDVMFSAGAAMSADIFERLLRASETVRGYRVPIVTGWGATETGPGATMVHDINAGPGGIGTPMPGVEIRLMPVGGKHELRVRGPSVMTGYWRRDDLSANVFDEDGFYCSGDAGKMVDPEHPDLGLMFDGRLVDDFKLANGSWVNTNRLRLDILRRADGALRDVVIVGADRPYVTALCWTDDAACLDDLFAAHNAENHGQTSHIRRFAPLDVPPCAEAGELTMKGEINRRIFLARRPEIVAALYEEASVQ